MYTGFHEANLHLNDCLFGNVLIKCDSPVIFTVLYNFEKPLNRLYTT